MKNALKFYVGLVASTATMTALAAQPSAIAVSQCWIRALPGNLPSGGYFTVSNSGDKPVDLISVKASGFEDAMLHRSQEQNGVSTMAPVSKAAVPPKGTLSFAPGDFHVMLEKPTKPLAVGVNTLLTLTFSDGEIVATSCEIKSASATGK